MKSSHQPEYSLIDGPGLHIGVLNTSIASDNYGDNIIMEAALSAICECCPSAYKIHLPTHEALSRTSYRIQRNVAFNIACGTNLLHSHMWRVKQWNVGVMSALRMKPVILLGVGWRSNRKWKTDWYTGWLLRTLLHREALHAVRDSYTAQHLQNIGVDNVLNTACPTMWSLTPDHCAQVPESLGEDVVVTLTDYSPHVECDRRLIEVLKKTYRNVYLWCQGAGDYAYASSLASLRDMHLVPSSLEAYDELLSDPSLSLDYVGTRLHGGIRALQHKRRTVIVGVDHRSLMKKRDFGLPVIDRYLSAADLERHLRSPAPCEIRIPHESIRRWKVQFGKAVAQPVVEMSR